MERLRMVLYGGRGLFEDASAPTMPCRDRSQEECRGADGRFQTGQLIGRQASFGQRPWQADLESYRH